MVEWLNPIAIGLGIPVHTLWAILGVALLFGVGLGIWMVTGQVLLSLMASSSLLALLVALGILPLWIFMLLIAPAFILLLLGRATTYLKEPKVKEKVDEKEKRFFGD